MSAHGILLEQRRRRVVELQRVVRAEAHAEPSLVQLAHGRIFHLDEQGIVGQRAEPETDLRQVVQVLQRRLHVEAPPVVDAVGEQVARRQVVPGPGLASVRLERKRVEPARLAQAVQRVQVGPDVVTPVRIRRVALVRPLSGGHVPGRARDEQRVVVGLVVIKKP